MAVIGADPARTAAPWPSPPVDFTATSHAEATGALAVFALTAQALTPPG